MAKPFVVLIPRRNCPRFTLRIIDVVISIKKYVAKTENIFNVSNSDFGTCFKRGVNKL